MDSSPGGLETARIVQPGGLGVGRVPAGFSPEGWGLRWQGEGFSLKGWGAALIRYGFTGIPVTPVPAVRP